MITATIRTIVAPAASTNSHPRLRRIVRVVLPMILLGYAETAAIAAAAESATGGTNGGLEEIIVTAQKREQNLQTVGTSITAMDAAQLEARGMKDATDIATMTPGLQFNQYSPTITVYNLRGVSQNDFSDHQEAPVAVYVDDAYVASMGALAGSMFDLDRVEILRGPQGTLFGRNATGGLIHYVSKKPSNDYSGYLKVGAGNYGALNTEGAINGALSDATAGRFSFATDSHDGYITNSLGPKANNQKQYAARAQLLIKPSDAGEILLSLHGLKNDHETSGIYSWQASHADPTTGLGHFIGPNDAVNGACGGCDDFGYKNTSGSFYRQSEDRVGLFDRTVWGLTGHVNWKLDGFQLTSVTDYLNLKKRYGEDSDISPNTIFNYDTKQNYHQFSQELRLNGEIGTLRWIGGVYYLNYSTANDEITDFSGLGAFIGAPFIVGGAHFTLDNRTWSGFGQIEQDFLDKEWTLIAGARYTNDSKSYNYVEKDPFPEGATGNVAPGALYGLVNTHSWGTYSAKLELDRKFSNSSMLYGSLNRGSKGGGYSAPSTGQIGPITSDQGQLLAIDPLVLRFDPETLTSYEFGWKSEFWNNTARLNAAAFYYDYKNYQGFVLNGLVQVVKNLNAKVKGAEVEFAVVPLTGLNIETGLSWLDSQADNVPMPVPAGAAPLTLNRELPQAPKLSLNFAVRYVWAALDGKFAVGIDSKWSDRQYLELINAPVDLQPAYAVANGRGSYTSGSGAWEAAVYVRNLTNKIYRVYNLDLSGPLGSNQGVYATPRTFGADFSYHWGK